MSRIIGFFSYYGAKGQAWSYYPPPEHDLIIEPFAGSASYALRYHERDVILIDLDDRIAGIWEWLINVPEDEFLKVPTLEGVERVSDLGLEGPARDFLTFWASLASTGRNTVSKLMRRKLISCPRSSFTKEGRDRLCGQLKLIRHWKVKRGTYREAPDADATWFIDPPYTRSGKHYKHSKIDYEDLADFCRSRNGLTVVCEGPDATWLPFRDLRRSRSSSNANMGRGRIERVWTQRS